MKTLNNVIADLNEMKEKIDDLSEKLDSLVDGLTFMDYSDEPIPPCDFQVGDEVDFVNMKDNNIEKLHGSVTDVCLKDDSGWFCRVAGTNGKFYRIPVVMEDTRKGTRVLSVSR